MFKGVKNLFAAKALILILTLLLISPLTALAQDESPDADGFLNDKTIDVLKSFQDEGDFRSFSNNDLDGAVDQKGLDNITGVIVYIVNIMKWAVGGLALLFLVLTIVRTISASADGSEEQLGKLKKHLVQVVSAFVVIFTIDFFVNNVFVISGGENFLGDTDSARRFAGIGSGEIFGIFRVVQAITGVAVVTSLVVSGMRLVGNAGDEEATTKAKKHIIYAVAGLILLGLAEVIVQGFLFSDAGSTIDVEAGKEIIVRLTNFAAGFISTLAVLSFFYAGYLYVFSGVGEDNTEKVKKIIIGAVISILVAAGAFAAVNTFVELDGSRSPEILQNQVDNLQ